MMLARYEPHPHIMFTLHAKLFLLVASISMVVIPLCTLFLVRDYLAPAFHLKQGVGEAVAIVCSVLAIQLVMVGSCFVAFSEDISEEEEALARKQE